MNQKSQSLENELNLFSPKSVPTLSANYQRIIRAQNDVIQLLRKEVKQLRQYIIYFSESNDITSKQDVKTNDSQTTQFFNFGAFTAEKASKKPNGLKYLISDIMKILKVKNIDEVLPILRKMEEKANQKLQPVFVEKIKEKEVPVIVEKVKEVQKQVLVQVVVEKEVVKEVEKEVIVQVQKVVEKQIPIFREKIVQKYIEKPSSQTSPNEEKSDVFTKKIDLFKVEDPKPRKNNFNEKNNKSMNFSKKQTYNRQSNDASFTHQRYKKQDRNQYREKYEYY